MSRSIIVLPDDTAKPILDAIHGAVKSLRIKMFVFSDPTMLAAVIDAHTGRSMSASCSIQRGATANRRTRRRAKS